MLEPRVGVAIAIAKMAAMPVVGFVSVLTLKNHFLSVSEDIAAPFYLVAMIAFITPTANNVMVMVELSGTSVKEGVARVIAYQYMLAPFLLSLTMACAVGIAQGIA